ncbi:MAG: DUF3006 domain-containing protein [Oscillospiraceae bacterium]|nr:DUF3006 domain-containing protein [Oscillospiraceae bacterium]
MLIVDRIVDDLAVCECDDGSYVDIQLAALPAGVREGSVLVQVDGTWVLDLATEQARRAKLHAQADELFG